MTTKQTKRSIWKTFDSCMHAWRELACTAHISTVHERILLKFERPPQLLNKYLLASLSDQNDRSLIILSPAVLLRHTCCWSLISWHQSGWSNIQAIPNIGTSSKNLSFYAEPTFPGARHSGQTFLAILHTFSTILKLKLSATKMTERDQWDT